jgi:uncharacterized membrane protein YbhN (UPF0104 family)
MDKNARQKNAFLIKCPDIHGRMNVYLLMAGAFFVFSFLTIYLLHRYCLEGRILVDPRLLSPPVIASLTLLLAIYYLADGMRLYLVVRAMNHRFPFRFIMKLVFVNIFFSNATPMATGGGFVQIYFLSRNGFSIGEATAATSIRTMIAALGMLTLAPVFFFLQPDLFDPFRNGNVFLYFGCIAGLYLTVIYIVLFRVRLLRVLLYVTMRFLTRKGRFPEGVGGIELFFRWVPNLYQRTSFLRLWVFLKHLSFPDYPLLLFSRPDQGSPVRGSCSDHPRHTVGVDLLHVFHPHTGGRRIRGERVHASLL